MIRDVSGIWSNRWDAECGQQWVCASLTTFPSESSFKTCQGEHLISFCFLHASNFSPVSPSVWCHMSAWHLPSLCPFLRGISPSVLSTPPLLAVCYSCWSNLENVPNPLSVLLPQRNTKWIRQDYCLPLPPPSRPPPLRLLLHAVTLSSSTYLSLFYDHLSLDILLFISRIKAIALSRWQTSSNIRLVTDALTGPVNHRTESTVN